MPEVSSKAFSMPTLPPTHTAMKFEVANVPLLAFGFYKSTLEQLEIEALAEGNLVSPTFRNMWLCKSARNFCSYFDHTRRKHMYIVKYILHFIGEIGVSNFIAIHFKLRNKFLKTTTKTTDQLSTQPSP